MQVLEQYKPIYNPLNFDIFRRKNRWELTKISAAVMGIEFSYAAETAFVSPTLLKIGEYERLSYVQIQLIWNVILLYYN